MKQTKLTIGIQPDIDDQAIEIVLHTIKEKGKERMEAGVGIEPA